MTPTGPSGQQDGAPGGADEPAPAVAGQLGRYAGHGLTMALSTALFAWLGSWADGRLGTGPVFVVAGVFVGFGAGFYSMMRQLGGSGGGLGGSGGGDDGNAGG